ncbi:MAG: sulfurtransferase [Pyrinomonadaceae bacterium]|nr:sulfurtransferase [Pyrinomonadaceae bacterium]
MDELIQFVARHGYLVVFFGVFLEQVGIPLPSNFLLIIAGALAGTGQLDLSLVVLLTLAAAIFGDTVWYFIGRARGYKVLGFLCKISLEPAACVSSARMMFLRHGEKSLLFAKFIPGLSTFAQPLAGASGMSLSRFLVFDGLGSLLWAIVFVGLGFLFSDQLEKVGDAASSFGWWAGLIIVLGLAFYFGRKLVLRKKLIKDLLVARITPEELNEIIEAEEEVTIIDLRDSPDFEANPKRIPMSLRMPPDELEQRHDELPRDRDIILFCT